MSCLQGYALTTYDYLVENMGMPREAACHKSTVEWDMTTFDVYDWKQEETPKDLYLWHIGGENSQALKDFEDITGIPTTTDWKARQ